MAREFRLPDPGEGIHEAEILDILVEKGEEVEEGQNVLVVETDKAALELPAPESGVVEGIHVRTGDTARVGDVLISFADSEKPAKRKETGADGEEPQEGEKRAAGDGADAAREQAAAEKPGHADEEDRKEEARKADKAGEARHRRDEGDREEAESAEPEREDGPTRSVPATRRLARELDVDLDTVTPTGPHGRVTDDDVRQAAERGDGAARPTPALPDFERWGEVAREPLRSIRRATADRMARAWSEIPHVTHMDAVAIDVLEDIRGRHRENGAGDGEDLSLTAFVAKALVAALREHPRFNASLDPDAREIVCKRYYNIGVAVATERGLLVPVVRDVDRKSVLDVSRELSQLAERTRRGEASKDELTGGSFTITNVGPLGGRAFTPIINWPEVAILGLGKARFEPVAERDSAGSVGFVPRLMLPLCLAFDHRVNDGADAAGFVARLMDLLADPEQFLVAA